MKEFILGFVTQFYFIFGAFMAGLYYKDFERGFSGKYKSLKMLIVSILTIWLAGLIVLWWSIKTLLFTIKKAL